MVSIARQESMMTKFLSKVGIVILLPCLLVLLLPFLVIPVSWFTLALTVFNIFIIIPPLLGTYYLIGDGHLLIRCAFIFKWDVSIASIVYIRKTNNPISSPALSLDRLEIIYDGGNQSVIISPADQVQFIDSIKKVNQGIQFKGKSLQRI